MASSKGGGNAAGSAGRYGVNPMNNAATGMQDMFRMLQQAGGSIQNTQAQTYNPATGQAQGYNPAQSQAAGYTAAQGAAQGYDATGMGAGQGYTANQQAMPDMIRSLMGSYQNPYEDEVVGRTTDNMQRSLQEMQNRNGAAASAAGAFGGSRHGITEAVTNAEGLRGIGDMTAQLRQQGFDTAAGLAGQDIANRMQVGGQNQQAVNNAMQFTAGNRQQADMFNAGAENDANSFLAQARNAMSQFNTGERNAQGQFNAGQRQQNNQFNAGSENEASGFLAAARNAMSQFNAGERNAAGQYNASARERFQTGRTQDLMSLASNMGNAAQASYGMGTNILDRQQAAGDRAQQLAQQVLNGNQQNFQQWAQNPQMLLQMLTAAASGSPLNGATTTTGTQQQPNTLIPNLIQAAGNMFQFAPIALSSARFKHGVTPTGRTVKSVSGREVPEVTFYYTEDRDPSQTCYTGIVAEDLPADDPAIVTDSLGRHEAVDYSKLEIAA